MQSQDHRDSPSSLMPSGHRRCGWNKMCGPLKSASGMRCLDVFKSAGEARRPMSWLRPCAQRLLGVDASDRQRTRGFGARRTSCRNTVSSGENSRETLVQRYLSSMQNGCLCSCVEFSELNHLHVETRYDRWIDLQVRCLQCSERKRGKFEPDYHSTKLDIWMVSQEP